MKIQLDEQELNIICLALDCLYKKYERMVLPLIRSDKSRIATLFSKNSVDVKMLLTKLERMKK